MREGGSGEGMAAEEENPPASAPPRCGVLGVRGSCCCDDGSLSLVNGSTWRGRDAWGLFREWALTYEATPMDGTVSYLQKQLVTSFFSFLFLRR